MRALTLFNQAPLFPRGFFDELFAEEQMARAFSPEWGIEENENHYKLMVDLPGVKKDDIAIEVKDNTLVVTGERKIDRKEGNNYDYRSYGKFEKRFNLDKNVNPESIEAAYVDGVLEVLITKAEKSKPRKIAILESHLKLSH